MLARDSSLVRAEAPYGAGTALIIAVQADDAEMVRILLDAGSDPYFNAPSSGPPLQYACNLGSVEVVRELIAHGVDVNRPSPGPNGNGTPLQKAAWGGGFEKVRLLVEHGADVNAVAPERPEPALRLAFWGVPPRWPERTKIVEYLIERGADVNAKCPLDLYMRSILSVAKEEKAPEEIIQMLIKHGAREEANRL